MYNREILEQVKAVQGEIEIGVSVVTIAEFVHGAYRTQTQVQRNDDWNSSSDYRATCRCIRSRSPSRTSRAHRRSTGSDRCPICVRGFTDWRDGIASPLRSRHVEPPRFPENPRSVCDSTLNV